MGSRLGNPSGPTSGREDCCRSCCSCWDAAAAWAGQLQRVPATCRCLQVTTLKMLVVALGCAVFTGIRGGLFTVGEV